MSLFWPGFLYLLLLIPLAVVVYVLVLRRRRRFAVRYSSLSLVREAAARQSWLRRHLPFMLFLLMLASLVLALTRPAATVIVPSNKATVILAVDVSLSMCSTDIPPNRLTVAKEAATSFIHNNKSGRQVGIVAFAGFAELIQPPTTNVRLLDNAVRYLSPARRTAIGSAILRSLNAISEVDGRISPINELNPSPDTVNPSKAPAEYSPHIIVLLTDGSSNAGPLPLDAAAQAVQRGVRIYTIGFGSRDSTNISPMNCGDGDLFGGFSFGGGSFGGGGVGGGGGGFRREVDEQTLTQIAQMTGGKYYVATNADELQKVFQSLPTYVIATRETIEISVFFTAFAALMGFLALILSLRWHPLP